MPDTPHLPDRQSHRWDRHDYTAGGYFVTICTHRRRHLFGAVVDEVMRLNDFGEIVRDEWVKSEQIRDEIELDEFVIMPNHMHAIVWIVGASGRTPETTRDDNPARATSRSPLQRARGPLAQSLGSLVAGYKSAVTRRINRHRDTAGAPVWQRNYYDHVIRTNDTARAIRAYIANNPARWHLDRYNPNAAGPDPQARTLWTMLHATTTDEPA